MYHIIPFQRLLYKDPNYRRYDMANMQRRFRGNGILSLNWIILGIHPTQIKINMFLMTHKLLYLFATCIYLILAPSSPGFAENVSMIYGYQASDSQDSSQFILYTNALPDYKIMTLHNPERIVLDLKQTKWPDTPLSGELGTRIQSLRKSAPSTPELRIVLDIVQPFILLEQKITPPTSQQRNYQIIVNFRPVNPLFDHLVAPILPPTTKAKPTPPSVSRWTPIPQYKPIYKPMIVIDAGHGGHDPGSLGRGKAVEKAITLIYAKALKNALLKTDRYRIYMTREHDKFIELDTRTKLAEKAKGDLFIALHADSHPNRLIRGLSVYTLSEVASDREAEALAKQANQSGAIGEVDIGITSNEVTPLLIDLAQRDTKNLSASFAETLVKQLQAHVTLLRNTHRFAGFRVLMSPSIPSVLIELGYLSNRQEEELLQSPHYQQKLIASTVKAIDMHFKNHPHP